jgi:glycosyltransferase involved in cell wall biosynthesis
MGDNTLVEARRPLVTIVLPAYNEAALLEENVSIIMEHLRRLENSYRFEIILVNDGSRDATPQIAEALKSKYANLKLIHHRTNFGLGQAFRTAFSHSRGDYVITMDVDLSYSPDHIDLLLETLVNTPAKLVLASPYMRGGRLTNVPWLRRILSVWGNRFLSMVAHGNLSTLTCMVRGYDGPFIRSLTLRSTGMDIMPEVVYKAMITRAKIEQIPAHLDWSRQVAAGVRRSSSMRIIRHILSTVLSGFVFRPFMFLVMPGLVLFLFSMYVNGWMFIHFFDAYFSMPTGERNASAAVAAAYAAHPHTFIVALLSLMLSIQLIGLGILALQAKHYFEELFFLGNSARSNPTQDVTIR